MSFIRRVQPALSLLFACIICVAHSSRPTQDQQIVKTDERLKAENAQLHAKVAELSRELRVAATGTLIKNRSDQKKLKEHRKGREQGTLGIAVQEADLDAEHGIAAPLSQDLINISNAIASDAAAVARKTVAMDSALDQSSVRDNRTKSKVLFILHGDSKFSGSRLKWARDTWAKGLPSSQLVILGDAKVHEDLGFRVHESRCRPRNESIMTSCKYAEAAVLAQSLMWENHDLEWVYIADDDSYIRADALEQALLTQKQTYPSDRGLVLANWGCVTEHCSRLMCGGSGYAANRWAIESLAQGDPAAFVQEMLQKSIGCGGSRADEGKGLWGEAGLSEMMRDYGFELRELPGLHGWMLEKSCFEWSLTSGGEPLMYHMIRTKSQMELLHRLFAPPTEQTGSSVPPDNSAALDGLGGCVEFRSNVQCAASQNQEDRPWLRDTGACRHPRMPRLPVLLGMLTLMLLFGVMTALIWAGLKHNQWEGWNAQGGLKWHNHHLLGRQRFR